VDSAVFKKEPAVIISVIGGAIIAAIQVLGPEFFPDLEMIAIQAVQAIVAVLTVFAVRLNVFSPATHVAEVEEALRKQPPEA
jgi:hypothetical protein